MVMKTTLNLDDHLLRAAKKAAAERGVTLTSIVEDALRAALIESPARTTARFRMPVVKGRRVPAVDVADRDALYRRMEETP
jgi:hypothetical protein